MQRVVVSVVLFVFTLAGASTASAQLLAAKDGPIVYGHHHVAASDIAAHTRFWADTLGGRAGKFVSGTDIVTFPNVIVFFRSQAPTGGTVGTTADHIGLSVPDLRRVVDRVKANGFEMITRAAAPATLDVVDDIARVNADTAIAFALGPDGVKVELLENRQQTLPVMLHHVHFFGPDNAAMRAWYTKVFGATERPAGGAFVSSTLPGVTLNFSQAAQPVIGTQGRAVDHIGFEIDGLEAFTTRLTDMGIALSVPYRKVDDWGLAIAFVTDPWGTSIELTEGLDTLN
jgi:catechol 2,3-dioxygenase-like lactoylglutathione lyase family enzyme